MTHDPFQHDPDEELEATLRQAQPAPIPDHLRRRILHSVDADPDRITRLDTSTSSSSPRRWLAKAAAIALISGLLGLALGTVAGRQWARAELRMAQQSPDASTDIRQPDAINAEAPTASYSMAVLQAAWMRGALDDQFNVVDEDLHQPDGDTNSTDINGLRPTRPPVM